MERLFDYLGGIMDGHKTGKRLSLTADQAATLHRLFNRARSDFRACGDGYVDMSPNTLRASLDEILAQDPPPVFGSGDAS